jgi:leucine dehydrogenase
MNIFELMSEHDYEQVIYFSDNETGLKGITVIHNTVLGPSLGGARIWNYESEEEALRDCLRLARGMTYKSACAGLNLGGGKTVLIGDANTVKSEAYFRAFGRYINGMGGRYITAEDVNTSTKDMNYIHMETNHVVGLEGKSGNPSPFTALGAFYGIKATLKHKFDNDEISDYSYAIQGVGQTGFNLVKLLVEHKAQKILYTDINQKNIEQVKEAYPELEFVEPEKFFGSDVDVLVPCALGGVLNDESIPQITAKCIAGTSNNVLLDEKKHAQMLRDKDILIAPDFVINAGGVINVYHEIQGYRKDAVISEVKLIYDRLLEIYQIADEQDITTLQAAKVFAKNRINSIKNVKVKYNEPR